MRRWLLGLALGMLLGWAAQGAAQPQPAPLEELLMTSARDETLAIPPEYGHLVSVAVSSEVHHLYLQDTQGVIRVVLVGPQGAMQRVRHGLHLLSRDVYTIERKAMESPTADPTQSVPAR
jgi:hypothetical protein